VLASGELYGMAIGDNLPGARFMLTYNLGHRCILRDRDVIAAVVAFIRNDPPGLESGKEHFWVKNTT
jgi:hypothetical protein